MFCLNEISLNGTGFCLSKPAKSASAITAYLPFVVSFIYSFNNNALYIYLTKIVKITLYKIFNKTKPTCDKRIFF